MSIRRYNRERDHGTHASRWHRIAMTAAEAAQVAYDNGVFDWVTSPTFSNPSSVLNFPQQNPMSEDADMYTPAAQPVPGGPHAIAQTVAVNTRPFKRPKVYKPSKSFKLKVLKALKSNEAVGTKQDISYLYFLATTDHAQGPIVNNNGDGNVFNTVVNGTTYSDYWMFHPYYFLDAASVLFLNKPVTRTYTNLNDAQSLGSGVAPGMTAGDTAGAQFEWDSAAKQVAKFTVVDSYEQWIIRNNTPRHMTIKFYLCQPRSPGFADGTSWNILTGTRTTVTQTLGPLAQWAQSCFEDYNQSLQPLTTPTNLHTEPTHTHGWNGKFKHDLQIIELPPGAAHVIKIPGPKMLEIDLTKYLVNGQIQDLRTYCRAPLMILVPDIVGAQTFNDPGRYAYQPGRNTSNSPGVSDGTQVGIERTRRCRIAYPNQVGPVVGALDANKPQQILSNAERYISNVWTVAGPYTHLNTIQEEYAPQVALTT